MPMRTAARRDTALPTRDRITLAAEKLFASHGYAGVSMPAIARASGITAGAIYKHFESKEHLFFEVIRRALETAPTAGSGNEPLDVARDLPRIVANMTTAHMKLARQLGIEVHYASAKHRKVWSVLKRSLEGSVASLSSRIAAGQRAGRIDPSLDPPMLSQMILALLLGLMNMETLAPQLVGNAAWEAFVEGRVAALLGVR